MVWDGGRGGGVGGTGDVRRCHCDCQVSLSQNVSEHVSNIVTINYGSPEIDIF